MRFTEHPATEAEALIERRHLQFFGLRLAWSSYSRPVFASSGAPVGILRSFWIYTRRHAWGWGDVVDWAKLQNLEVKIGPLAPIVTEHGHFWIVPPLAIATTPQGDGRLDIRIHNRNPVDAIITLKFFDTGYRMDPDSLLVARESEPEAAIGVQFHTVLMRNTQKSFGVAVDRPHVFTHARVETAPALSSERRARIYGRPEWGA
jgi:hypothetical protein